MRFGEMNELPRREKLKGKKIEPVKEGELLVYYFVLLNWILLYFLFF